MNERSRLQADGAAGDTSFPLRLGAIDAGSNAIRLTVAEFQTPTTYQVLAQDRLPVRLGQDVFLSGRLTAGAMERAVSGLGALRQQMDDLGVKRYRAVTTSAVREAANGEEFVERVRRQAGLELEQINGSEEARLVYLAARSKVRFGRRKWLIVDVGGGSVEVVLVNGNGVLWSESHTMGAVRLLEELRIAGDEPGRFQRLVEEYVATLRLASSSERWHARGFVATGGNIETLARLAGAPQDENGVSVLSVDALRSVTESIARLSFAQRVEQLDLREDRADVILPAAVLYERLSQVMGADRLVVPHVGVREGVLLDLAEDVVGHGEHELGRDRGALAAALTLGRRYLFEEDHGVQVGQLAASLFDQLQSLHGLPHSDRRLLLAAGILHDIGLFVSYKKHHKHSLYLILSSDIAGFTPRELLLMANIARYHRKSPPTAEHEYFAQLSAAEKERVSKLGALLRVADALDREHRQAVEDVHVELRDGTVVLQAVAMGDLLLERWAVERKADLFERVYGRKLRLTAKEPA